MTDTRGVAHAQKTVEAVQKDSDVVGRAALEFWSTLGEQELIINERNEEAQMAGMSPVAVNYNYCKTALPLLVPMLTTCMTNQDDHQDEDTWNVAMASATCLGLLAQVCQATHNVACQQLTAALFAAAMYSLQYHVAVSPCCCAPPLVLAARHAAMRS